MKNPANKYFPPQKKNKNPVIPYCQLVNYLEKKKQFLKVCKNVLNKDIISRIGRRINGSETIAPLFYSKYTIMMLMSFLGKNIKCF